jgi:hypothetical protein
MPYKIISLALVAVLLHGSIVAQAQPQPPAHTVAQMQRVLRKAQEKNKAVKVILRKMIDNQTTFSGNLSDISDTGFVLTNQRTQTTKTFAYEDSASQAEGNVQGCEDSDCQPGRCGWPHRHGIRGCLQCRRWPSLLRTRGQDSRNQQITRNDHRPGAPNMKLIQD